MQVKSVQADSYPFRGDYGRRASIAAKKLRPTAGGWAQQMWWDGGGEHAQ